MSKPKVTKEQYIAMSSDERRAFRERVMAEASEEDRAAWEEVLDNIRFVEQHRPGFAARVNKVLEHVLLTVAPDWGLVERFLLDEQPHLTDLALDSTEAAQGEQPAESTCDATK